MRNFRGCLRNRRVRVGKSDCLLWNALCRPISLVPSFVDFVCRFELVNKPTSFVMYPSLAMRNLENLPIALRGREKAAANGSHVPLAGLQLLPTNVPRLPPVYYAGLDVAAMPSLLTQLDSGTEFDLESVIDKLSHVMICLQGLLLLDDQSRTPIPSSPDIWARAWPWIGSSFSTRIGRFWRVCQFQLVNLRCP
ncbi:hypothetical protein DFH08DRAFT_275129 [Mycena albidolilacea]|uniref:Uncharacterized protein n=1 Tax=Mycena albidolilacea TaxID=1033008 RepID=A0AAD7APQ4_9AGAR|nr:hypothetical protein DFH08DRAFT_275129 [Mycena albidolilacea]